MMEYFVSALTQVVQPLNLAVILLGTIVGILAGAMPGLSSIMALTIVTPFTFSLGGNSGILMLLGVFCGAIYGGSLTAIPVSYTHLDVYKRQIIYHPHKESKKNTQKY